MAYCKNYEPDVNPCGSRCPHDEKPPCREPVDIKITKSNIPGCARVSRLTIGDMQHGDIFDYASYCEAAFHDALYRCVSNRDNKVECVELGGYVVHTFNGKGLDMAARRWTSVSVTAVYPVTTKD